MKFRIWNKIDNKFYTYNKLDTTKWLIDMNGNLGYIDLTDFSWGGLIPKGFYEINQYTGIKDCNGKEIYVGDIVRDKSLSDDTDYIYEIVFIEGAFVTKWLGNFDNYLYEVKGELEIIGNKYKNVDLI